MNIGFKLVSSLVKVLSDTEPEHYPSACPISLLQGEVFSLQAAYCLKEEVKGNLPFANIDITCDLKVTVRQVFNVPVRFPKFWTAMSTTCTATASCTDLLRRFTQAGRFAFTQPVGQPVAGRGSGPESKPGIYTLSVVMKDENGQALAQDELHIESAPRSAAAKTDPYPLATRGQPGSLLPGAHVLH